MEIDSKGDEDVDEIGCIIHEVTCHDTLQGISIRYGVSLDEIRRCNGLWIQDDVIMRKNLSIPLKDASKKRAILEFSKMTDSSCRISANILNSTNWNFSKAIGLFFSLESEEKDMFERNINPRSSSSIPAGKEEILLSSFDDLLADDFRSNHRHNHTHKYYHKPRLKSNRRRPVDKQTNDQDSDSNTLVSDIDFVLMDHPVQTSAKYDPKQLKPVKRRTRDRMKAVDSDLFHL